MDTTENHQKEKQFTQKQKSIKKNKWRDQPKRGVRNHSFVYKKSM